MVIGIDLVHAAVWRFDIQRKSGAGRAADFAEVSVVADLGELAVDLLGGTVAALENGFEGDALKDLDLVLIPAPGVDGAVFTPGECEALDRYVQEGGAVLILGDGEWPQPPQGSAPFLGREDNARLLLNLLSWLLDGRHQGSAADLAAQVTGAYRFSGRDFSPTENLKNEPGPHVADAGVYAHLFTGLADGFLRDSETDEEAFLREAELRFHEMPRVVRQAVSRFRQHGTDSGVLLVKGLPVDPALPPTPADPKARVRFASPLSELWLAAFAQALGEPIGYRQEKNGLLFQNVVPTPHNAAKLSSESSAILLDYHTETAFHPFMPDYVLLHCLRPDHDGRDRWLQRVCVVRDLVPSAGHRRLRGRIIDTAFAV
ncbi:TauD/TfdA family dioxygenase [Microbispora triticiradicis]|uniref:TauD/TfdA family dioxygenase n=1 Tax=Microbispora triticiradicis TaxID=2200763 RepID=UPI001AD6ABEC|nr:TauD/TfdA family dioxygenase [Microbispora triticiradicis]MBO4272815.1 hypothetical protein [Microbispora triticiradicis]